MGCSRVAPYIRSMIEQEASANGLDPDFLEAVVLTENGELYPNNPPTGILPGIYLDSNNVYAHGVMAVHVVAAIDAGFTGTILIDSEGRQYAPALADEATSIKYGARYLANRGTGKYGSVGGPVCSSTDFVCLAAAYVQGNTKRRADGSWWGQSYVNNVNFHYRCITGRTLADARNQSGPIKPPGYDGPPPPDDPPSHIGSIPCIGFNLEKERIWPFPMPSQPYFAYFSVGIVSFGDIALGLPRTGRTLAPPRPQYITRFELTEQFGGTNTCLVRFFDPNWDFTELLAGYTPSTAQQAAISFGYSAQERDYSPTGALPAVIDGGLDLWSPEHSMRVRSFHPEFLGWGVEVEMSFYGVAGLMGLTHHTECYEGKRPTEIVEEVAGRHKLKVCTVPSSRLLEEGAALATAVPKDKPFLQDESDLAFLNRLTMDTVSDTVVSEENNRKVDGDYRVWVDDASPDAEKVLHYHQGLWDSPPIRQYTYLRQQYGAVIEWRPDIQEEALAYIGGHTTETRSFDPGSKEFVTSTSDVNTTKGATRGGDTQSSPLDLYNDEKVQVKRVFPSTRGTVIGEHYVEGVNFFEKAFNWKSGGTLIVIGDPLVRPARNVLLLVFTFVEGRDGKLAPVLNFTSGVYNIQRVTHLIQGGEYLTVLELQANRNFKPYQQPSESTDPQGAVRDESFVERAAATEITQSDVFFNAFPNNLTR